MGVYEGADAGRTVVICTMKWVAYFKGGRRFVNENSVLYLLQSGVGDQNIKGSRHAVTHIPYRRLGGVHRGGGYWERGGRGDDGTDISLPEFG